MKGTVFFLGLLVLGVALGAERAAGKPLYGSPGSTRHHMPPLGGGPTGKYRYYQFDVVDVNKTINCQTKTIVTVNGMYPGPTIYANEGDRVIVNVTNYSSENATIHFHGIRQENTNWMDGVNSITMCAVQKGDYFVHDFTLPLQRGTFLWHAHIATLRATVHGAFVVYPPIGTPYPFPNPAAEFEIVIGEWWYKDVQALETAALYVGGTFPNADLITLNGQIGPLFNSCNGVLQAPPILDLVAGNTYLIRVVHAGINSHLFFQIAGHMLTVVEADGAYVQPFDTPRVFFGPGQTHNILVTALDVKIVGSYYVSVSGFESSGVPTVRPSAVLHSLPRGRRPGTVAWTPTDVVLPALPADNLTGLVAAFTNSLKTLYPGRVPLTVTQELYMVVGITRRFCLPFPQQNCTPDANGTRLRVQAAINNVTFDEPHIALAEADYFGYKGVFTEDFPFNPPHPFDFTGAPSPPAIDRISNGGTKVIPIPFNSTVQMVMQGTLPYESHPFHLHGHNFYVLAQGFGNYNPVIDPLSFNLYDPPLRNTIGIPTRGWVALRWKANNPGMWLYHCHLDKHTSEGMQTVFKVGNGPTPAHQFGPPPARRMPCGDIPSNSTT